jgi:photosystem II stability/assembly factor-like uncharacterized protein
MQKNQFILAGKILIFLLAFHLVFPTPDLFAQRRSAAANIRDASEDSSSGGSGLNSGTFSGLRFRNIGPAHSSGRVAAFAVNPEDPTEYYVGVASGNIWKTVNNGTTYTPIFENYGSYAIGAMEMDPNNPHVVWAGTGENNSQRALGYGDGVYKTEDGGRSWKNMGLKESRQIGKILIHPGNSDVVYVAAEGSVWGPGGERGIYKTTDGGKTWNAVLTISENTGVRDMVMDPRNPDVIYASSHQRRRHVFTKINGGPESAIYKTTDGGKTWNKLSSGLPSGDVGAIGLAISPVNPDILYAIIEAQETRGGFFRSTNRGASWEKMSSYVAGSPQYYNRIIPDPVDVNKVYSMDVVSRVTVDGGRTFNPIGNRFRHVDDHAFWVNPQNTRHMLIGGDGGIYESFDAGDHWIFKSNLPITQFYRVAVDNSLPFYYVYGGTQDNNSMGGPSRTIRAQGIVNDDWFVTNGGDGFWSAIDPVEPNIVYAESQHGGMVRYDRKSGESISIKPQPRKGEMNYRWNWNTPLFISPHSNTRIYVAAEKVFRSDDRGNTWQVISDDLTQQIDRNKLPVMDRVWSVDAVAKNASTSLYGSIVSLDESRVKEDLLYAGTDDGIIQVTEDAGKSWRKVDNFPGVPKNTYVSHLLADRFNENFVYASFDNIKQDDFKPYILKSTDKGKSWNSISSNLPKNGTVHTIAQDHVNPDLLFVGTEFGVFFTIDGGKEWVQLKSGLPTISVKHIVIQERENDLVLATFGRGFYILDDYTPLRYFNKELLKKPAEIMPVKDALIFVQERGKGSQGSMYYAAPNPPVAAIFTYYMKDPVSTIKQQRQRRERDLIRNNQPVPYPSWNELRAEDTEESPFLIFTVFDEEDNVVRRLTRRAATGINRVEWDLRYQGTGPIRLQNNNYNPMSDGQSGMMVMPGKYKVSLAKSVNGLISPLTGPVEFNVVPLENTTLPAQDRAAKVAFQKEISELSRVVQGTVNSMNEINGRLNHIKQAILNTPSAPLELMNKANEVEEQLYQVGLLLQGDRTISSRYETTPASISARMSSVISAQFRSTSAPTQTQREQYIIVKEEIAPVIEILKKISETDIPYLESELDKVNAPWTPGRLLSL